MTIRRHILPHFTQVGYISILLSFLGLLLLPAVAGAATAGTTISSQISSVISLFTTSTTVNVNVTPTASGAQTIASDTVTVSTNDSSGYTLQIANSDTTTSLSSGTDTIAASSGTQASPTTQSANTWGYRVDNVGGFGAGPTSSQSNGAIGSLTFAGVPASTSPNTLKNTSSTASGEQTIVWYAVAADTSQPSGTYTDTVTYTATVH